MAALVPFLGGRVTLVACAALCSSNANCFRELCCVSVKLFYSAPCLRRLCCQHSISAVG